VSASKLDKGEPVLGFLGPTSTQSTAFGQPTEGALNDPTASGELGFAGNRTTFKEGFVATATMFDMSHIAFLLDKLVNIGKIIAFVQAQMLFDVLGVRAWHHHRKDDFIAQPFVMNIRASKINAQWRTAAIDQNVDFAAAFATVDRAFAGGTSAQRGWTRFAVDSLPRPVDTPSVLIELDQLPHQTRKAPIPLPLLKTLMKGRATHAKPVSMHSLPLAARPQHIPYPVHAPSIFGSLAARPLVFSFRRQYPLQSTPQWTRYVKIIDILWLLCMILAQDVSVLVVVWLLQSERDTSLFLTSFAIYG
jgi:hypothetical protein